MAETKRTNICAVAWLRRRYTGMGKDQHEPYDGPPLDKPDGKFRICVHCSCVYFAQDD